MADATYNGWGGWRRPQKWEGKTMSERVELVSVELGDIVETFEDTAHSEGPPSGRTYEVIDFCYGECHAWDLSHGPAGTLRVRLSPKLAVHVVGHREEPHVPAFLRNMTREDERILGDFAGHCSTEGDDE